MIPEHFYMTDLGKIAYLALYLPLVLGLFWWLYRKFKSAWAVWMTLALVVLTLPFWDVYMIGRDAERLCKEQGGLHVYKAVEVEGFRGSIENWEKLGFSYIESFWVGPDKKKYRYRMVNGEKVTEEISEFASRYGIKGKKYEVIGRNFGKNSIGVADLYTGEFLGELTILNIHPGRFDGFFLKMASSGPVVWHCGDEPPAGRIDKLTFQDVVIATLKPKQNEGGAQ